MWRIIGHFVEKTLSKSLSIAVYAMYIVIMRFSYFYLIKTFVLEELPIRRPIVNMFTFLVTYAIICLHVRHKIKASKVVAARIIGRIPILILLRLFNSFLDLTL